MAVVILLAAMLVGCSPALRDDPTVFSAFRAGYSTAELWSGKDIKNGLLIKSVEKGQKLDSLDIYVQGYYEGIIEFKSSSCNVQNRINYKKNAKVRVPITGLMTQDCVISVTVNPEYPGIQKSGVEAFPLTGWIFLKMTNPGEFWLGTTRKVAGSWSSKWNLNISDTDPIRLFITGCGKDVDRVYQTNQGRLSLDLQDLVYPISKPRVCILDGVIISKVYRNMPITALMNIYIDGYQPLTEPTIKSAGGKVEVVADPAVAILAYNGDYVLDHRGKFKFNGDGDVVRMITMKGRTLYGKYQKGGWKWQR